MTEIEKYIDILDVVVSGEGLEISNDFEKSFGIINERVKSLNSLSYKELYRESLDPAEKGFLSLDKHWRWIFRGTAEETIQGMKNLAKKLINAGNNCWTAEQSKGYRLIFNDLIFLTEKRLKEFFSVFFDIFNDNPESLNIVANEQYKNEFFEFMSEIVDTGKSNLFFAFFGDPVIQYQPIKIRTGKSDLLLYIIYKLYGIEPNTGKHPNSETRKKVYILFEMKNSESRMKTLNRIPNGAAEVDKIIEKLVPNVKH